MLVEAGHDLASALLGEPPDAGGGAGVSLGALTVVEAVHGEEFLAELDVRLHLRRVGGGGDGRQDGPTIRGVRTRRLVEVELRSAGRGCAGFGGRTCSRLRSLEDEDAISLVRERA